MSRLADSSNPASAAPRWHPAWRMVAIAAAALLTAGTYTTIAGLITDPLTMDEGWSRSQIGIAVAINMVLYGATAPFSAALMDRYGLRRITVGALLLLAASSALLVTATPSAGWFVVWWGILVGTGTGSITMVFGATVANRWFVERIGLATGILTAASVVGQFAMLPVLSALMAHTGWHGPIIVCGVLAAVTAALVIVGLRNDPYSLNLARYGASTDPTPPDIVPGALSRTWKVLTSCSRDPRFWLLAGMFFLCGATTNGLMWSHFTPAAHDHGMAPTAASSLLAIVGFANIAGTISSGWLTDRIAPRYLLALFFLIRGVTLAVLPLIFTSQIDPGLVAFAIAFGILDVATVPPTIALCRNYFGSNSALAFGWVNVFHQIGAGSMAVLGGVIRDDDGTYTPVWITGAVMCVVAAAAGASATTSRRKTSASNPARRLEEATNR